MKYVFLTCLLLPVLSFGQVGAKAQTPGRRIEIVARRYSFAPAEITVRRNEAVTLALTSQDVTHSLLIPGLHINATASKGRVTEVTVTPDKVGDFPGRCGRFCGSGHGSMLFVVHVTNK